MGGQAPVELSPLGVRDRERVRIVGDAVPDRLNELDTVFDAEVQYLLKLTRAHAQKFTSTSVSTQSARSPSAAPGALPAAEPVSLKMRAPGVRCTAWLDSAISLLTGPLR